VEFVYSVTSSEGTHLEGRVLLDGNDIEKVDPHEVIRTMISTINGDGDGEEIEEDDFIEVEVCVALIEETHTTTISYFLSIDDDSSDAPTAEPVDEAGNTTPADDPEPQGNNAA
jgi:hypothetical protein